MSQLRGKWGCLGAVVASGVGFVLFGLGFESHTTEALPFGVALLVVGAALGLPALRALRGALRRSPAIDPARPGGSGRDRPASSISLTVPER